MAAPDFLDVLITAIAQNQLNAALAVGQRQHFGLLGSRQQRHRGGLDGLPFGIGLNRGSGGENQHVLERSNGFGSTAGGRIAGHQNVHVHTREHKTGDAADVVDAHRYRAHSDRNDGRQSQTASARGQASFNHRLVYQEVADHRTIDYFLGLGEGAFGKSGRDDFGNLDVGGFDVHAD